MAVSWVGKVADSSFSSAVGVIPGGADRYVTVPFTANVSKSASAAALKAIMVLVIQPSPARTGSGASALSLGDDVLYDGTKWGTRWAPYGTNKNPLAGGFLNRPGLSPDGAPHQYITNFTRTIGNMSVVVFWTIVFADITTSNNLLVKNIDNLVTDLRVIAYEIDGQAFNISAGTTWLATGQIGTERTVTGNLDGASKLGATGFTTWAIGDVAFAMAFDNGGAGTGRTASLLTDGSFAPDDYADMKSVRLAIGHRTTAAPSTRVEADWSAGAGDPGFDDFFTLIPGSFAGTIPDQFSTVTITNVSHVDNPDGSRTYTVTVNDPFGIANATTHKASCYWWSTNFAVPNAPRGFNGFYSSIATDPGANGHYQVGGSSKFKVPANETYDLEAFLYDGVLSNVVSLSLAGQTTTTPPNDLIANAQAITPGAVPQLCDVGWTKKVMACRSNVKGTTVGARFAEDSNIPYAALEAVSPFSGGWGPSVWYTWKPSVDTDVMVVPTSSGGDYTNGSDWGMTIYTGPDGAATSDLDSLVIGNFQATSPEDALDATIWATFKAKAHQRYYFQVATGWEVTAGITFLTGTFGFDLYTVPPYPASPGSTWRPSYTERRISFGPTQAFFTYDTANTSTIVKAVGPARCHACVTEPKLADCQYLLVTVAYDDPTGAGGNSVTGITDALGTTSGWTQITQFTPGGVGLVHELWIGKRAVAAYPPDSPVETLTVTLASATTLKGASVEDLYNLDPTSPVAGTISNTSHATVDHLDTNFNVGALLSSPLKGMIAVLWAINSPDEAVSPQLASAMLWPLDTVMPSFQSAATGVDFPGKSALGFSSNGTSLNGNTDLGGSDRRGYHALNFADFRQSPNPAYPPAGIRNLSYKLSLTSGGTAHSFDAYHGVFGVLFQGAPQT